MKHFKVTMIQPILFLVVLFPAWLYGQEKDSITASQMETVLFIDHSAKTTQPLATLDAHMEAASSINMIRRGAYAWEPYLNGMSSERNVLTIDGMRIYAACTDKMDPTNSYVEVQNFSKMDVQHGPGQSEMGAGIAGGINLVSKKSQFGTKAQSGQILMGWEQNANAKMLGGNINLVRSKWGLQVNTTYRDANPYKIGGGEKLAYTQFSKWNAAANFGYKLNNHHQFQAQVIYDYAWNVGYPALPMDVKSAEGLISSLTHIYHHSSSWLQHWETKLYYNKITHIMDDSHRPDVPVRMDMPGWITTAGFYTYIAGKKQQFDWRLQLNGHVNNSLAEMTMYANNASEPNMYMLTWPDINTYNADLFYKMGGKLRLHWNWYGTVGTAFQQQRFQNEMGLNSVSIFFPDTEQYKNRILPRASFSVAHSKNIWTTNFAIGYGQRAPSVSEAYGFYLFNSFDKYDYIGNPNLKNESSLFGTISSAIHPKWGMLQLSAKYSMLQNYILGFVSSDYSPMTIGASGVRIYGQLPQANIINLELNGYIFWLPKWKHSFQLSYRKGSSAEMHNLPLIQPLQTRQQLAYESAWGTWQLSVWANARYYTANKEFGETIVPAFAIVDAYWTKNIQIAKQDIQMHIGIQNIFDKKYTTFTDWNRIPRMGRNVFVQLRYTL